MWFTPSYNERPSADSYIEAIGQKPEDYRVLSRMPLNVDMIPYRFPGAGEPARSVAILDTETTGLTDNADVIDLAILRCGVDASNQLCCIDEVYSGLNDPGRPIPPHIAELTGITDEMVKGQSIEKSTVHHILRDDPVIVAHNAAFDRPLFEKLFPNDDHNWACSMEYCGWYRRGFETKKLEILLEREGFFYDAHRAYMDCLAVAFLLHLVPESLAEILEPRIKITAVKSPIDVKDVLKKRGYRWDGMVWSKNVVRKEYGKAHGMVPDESPYAITTVEVERTFLRKLYRHGRMARVRSINLRKEFKKQSNR